MCAEHVIRQVILFNETSPLLVGEAIASLEDKKHIKEWERPDRQRKMDIRSSMGSFGYKEFIYQKDMIHCNNRCTDLALGEQIACSGFHTYCLAKVFKLLELFLCI